MTDPATVLKPIVQLSARLDNARPGEVEEMIQNRLGEGSWRAENRWPDEEGLWPESFCLGGMRFI